MPSRKVFSWVPQTFSYPYLTLFDAENLGRGRSGFKIREHLKIHEEMHRAPMALYTREDMKKAMGLPQRMDKGMPQEYIHVASAQHTIFITIKQEKHVSQ